MYKYKIGAVSRTDEANSFVEARMLVGQLYS